MTNFLSTEQLDHLLQLLKFAPTCDPPTDSLAQTNDLSSAYFCGFTLAPWLIDSSASDYMTSSSKFFSILLPLSR